MANICNVRIGNTATKIAVSWAGAQVGAKSLGAFGAWTGGLVGGAGADQVWDNWLCCRRNIGSDLRT